MISNTYNYINVLLSELKEYIPIEMSVRNTVYLTGEYCRIKSSTVSNKDRKKVFACSSLLCYGIVQLIDDEEIDDFVLNSISINNVNDYNIFKKSLLHFIDGTIKKKYDNIFNIASRIKNKEEEYVDIELSN